MLLVQRSRIQNTPILGVDQVDLQMLLVNERQPGVSIVQIVHKGVVARSNSRDAQTFNVTRRTGDDVPGSFGVVETCGVDVVLVGGVLTLKVVYVTGNEEVYAVLVEEVFKAV